MTTTTRKARQKTFQSPERRSPEERAEAVKALTDQLTTAVKDITSDEQWFAMLRVAAQFHQYSINNIFLLWAQAEARGVTLTQVAGFQRWKSLKRHVRKGEKS